MTEQPSSDVNLQWRQPTVTSSEDAFDEDATQEEKLKLFDRRKTFSLDRLDMLEIIKKLMTSSM